MHASLCSWQIFRWVLSWAFPRKPLKYSSEHPRTRKLDLEIPDWKGQERVKREDRFIFLVATQQTRPSYAGRFIKHAPFNHLLVLCFPEFNTHFPPLHRLCKSLVIPKPGTSAEFMTKCCAFAFFFLLSRPVCTQDLMSITYSVWVLVILGFVFRT